MVSPQWYTLPLLSTSHSTGVQQEAQQPLSSAWPANRLSGNTHTEQTSISPANANPQQRSKLPSVVWTPKLLELMAYPQPCSNQQLPAQPNDSDTQAEDAASEQLPSAQDAISSTR
jgi:hypothetical protein